jgi:predicted phosphate transport protein (TIGR00153 family)
VSIGKVTRLLGKTRKLEYRIDEFLDRVTESGIIFNRAVRIYLQEGASKEFDVFLEDIVRLETIEDNLRREIESEIYARTLIPDLRADVLRLLEDTDGIVNSYEAMLFRLSIQKPEIPEQFHEGYKDLCDTVVTCVESLVLGARAFFRDMEAVRDHCIKTILLETQCDKLSTKIQRGVFDSDLPLERKIHLRYFVERVDDIANLAEDVADTLQIYTIKRRV